MTFHGVIENGRAHHHSARVREFARERVASSDDAQSSSLPQSRASFAGGESAEDKLAAQQKELDKKRAFGAAQFKIEMQKKKAELQADT